VHGLLVFLLRKVKARDVAQTLGELREITHLTVQPLYTG
jgi:hypothetical protein